MVNELVLWLSISAVMLGVIFLVLIFVLALNPPRRMKPRREVYEAPERREVNRDLRKIKEQISGDDEEQW